MTSPNENADIASQVDALVADVPGDEPLRGTRFINDAADMLRATREIEQSIRRGGRGTLYVGFQDAERLDDEVGVYHRLINAGVSVVAFGVGKPEHELDGLRWTEVRRDRYALHNQWFLISTGVEPIAFIGYETSPDDVYRKGPAGNDERTWRGFVTDEARVINHVIDTLEEAVRDPDASVARWYLAATRDGSDVRYDATRAAAFAAARRDGAGVVLYDRTTESYLTSPYPSGPWSDEHDAVSAAWRLTPERLDSLGRAYLADQVREGRREGLPVIAHLAQDAGRSAIRDAITRYQPDAVFLPRHLEQPSLLDRVLGNTLSALTEGFDVTVHVVDDDGTVTTRE
jgi:hypothetical protein